jgi:tRNA (guanine-N7-)-methyltransferase
MDEARRRTLFGRRRGKKLRVGQQSLIDTLLPRLALTLPPEPAKIDLAQLFGGRLPSDGVWLEVGFGAGEHLVWQAEQNPGVGLIGCEPYLNGVARCLASIERAGVSNIRLFTDDARLVMGALPDQSLSRVFVLFPDPWPKLRHHKRRFVQRETLDRMAELMIAGAELRVATDDPSYLPWMVEHACTHPAFEWLAAGPADWRERPTDWPATRYEKKMLAGKPSFLRFRRREGTHHIWGAPFVNP